MKKKHPRGFTIIELVLTIILVGIISGVTAKILMSGIDTYSLITSRKDAFQNARVSMDRMVSEATLLRSSDIISIGNEQLRFYDRSGYSTSFKRASKNGLPVINRGNDFLGGLLGILDFDYLKADGTGTSTISQIKKINIEISIDTLGGYGSIDLRTEVFPRSLMYDNFQ